MTLAQQQRFIAPTQGVYFFGTTPPKGSTDDMQMDEIATKLLQRLENVDYDGLIVYDIQDESSRTDKSRPFPFMGTRDPREYSALLAQKSDHCVITYKSVSQRDRPSFDQWLHEAWNDYGVRNLVLVGSPSADASIKLSLNDAYEALAAGANDFSLGGVTIAERHACKGNEHQRLVEKSNNGCDFFISQAVYDADATIKLLREYGALCEQQDRQPSRIILTFTPCGSAKTLEFMNWLGISVPSVTRAEILESTNPLQQSVQVCQRNLERILDACLPLGIPVGLNIESLTNRKEEIDASIQLFKELKQTLETRLEQTPAALLAAS
ncbi:MAG: 5,10-methylenetetrahydrofolate reductase [Motiliproteus sp.]|jgi:5,10-methylenetetrahydrofolate reductase